MRAMLFASACAVAQVALALPVQAQTATDQAAASNDAAEEEIVVTAERRATNLQTTPIAATVLTGEELANSGVTNVDQLQFISPGGDGQQFRPGHRLQHPRHRQGRAQHADHHGRDHLSRRRGDLPGLLHRRAVLRHRARRNPARPAGHVRRPERHGRRGVRHLERSRSSTAAITATSRAQVGNYNDFGAQGAINLPVSDTFAARVAFNGDSRDSFYDITGPYTGDDGVQTGSGRLGMLWEPSENLSVLFKTDYNYLDLCGLSGRSGATPPTTCSTSRPTPTCTRCDRFGRSVLQDRLRVRQRHDAALGHRLPGRPDANTAPTSTARAPATTSFGDSVDETIYSQELNLISPDAGHVHVDPRRLLPARQDTTSRPASSTSACRPGFYLLDGTNPKETGACSARSASTCRTASSCSSARATPNTSTTNDVNVNQYGLPLTQDQTADVLEPLGQGRAELDGQRPPLPLRASSPPASGRAA